MITVAFAGDIAPCGAFESLVLKKQQRIFGDTLPILESADLAFGNLECPLTNHAGKINKSGPALKADPGCATALTVFSVLGLANNHILDFGKKGLEETIESCRRAGIPTVGAGSTLSQAQAPFMKKVKGLTVALIALAEHEFNQSENGGAGSAPIDGIDTYRQIMEARSQADIVIVTLHAGNEYFAYPRPGLRKLCHHYIDLGAEAVVCHHPHVPGAYEYYKGKPVIYSLGNFIFDTAAPPEGWDRGFLAQLHFDEKNGRLETLELIPYCQSVPAGGVNMLRGAEREALLARLEGYRKNLEDHEGWMQEWRKFVKAQSNLYLMRQYLPLLTRGRGFLAGKLPFLGDLFFSNRSCDLDKLNMLRCQSHRELLTAVLESRSRPRGE